MFISPAFAQTATAAAGNPTVNILIQIAPWLLIGGAFWFLLLRPQQVQQKQHKARLSALKRGDKVVTSGGILGLVKKAAEGSDNIEVEIAPNVVVSVLRSTITSVVSEAPAAANDKG